MAFAKLEWHEIDADNLSKSLAKLYADVQTAKAHFEASMTEALRARSLIGADQSAYFAYRRGIAYAVKAASNGNGKTKVKL